MSYKQKVVAEHVKIAEDIDTWFSKNKKLLAFIAVIIWLLIFTVTLLYMRNYDNIILFILLSFITGILSSFYIIYSQLTKQNPIICEFLSIKKMKDYLSENN